MLLLDTPPVIAIYHPPALTVREYVHSTSSPVISVGGLATRDLSSNLSSVAVDESKIPCSIAVNADPAVIVATVW
jgi:hypothetical protein